MNRIIYKLHPDLFENGNVKGQVVIAKVNQCENVAACKELLYEMFKHNTSNDVALSSLGDNISMDKNVFDRCVMELLSVGILTSGKPMPYKESEELSTLSEELIRQQKNFSKFPRFRTF